MLFIVGEALDSLDPGERLTVPIPIMNNIDMFMGGLNPTSFGENLIHLQSNFAQTAAEEQQLRGTSNTGTTMRNPGPQQSGSNYTFTQRITGY